LERLTFVVIEISYFHIHGNVLLLFLWKGLFFSFSWKRIIFFAMQNVRYHLYGDEIFPLVRKCPIFFSMETNCYFFHGNKLFSQLWKGSIFSLWENFSLLFPMDTTNFLLRKEQFIFFPMEMSFSYFYGNYFCSFYGNDSLLLL
jgi:hypothetical protein